ncbi:MAG: tetratricopeptide repeat protein, partial [Sedimentisphaerales bacterium]|nr:tetratricopeptide repeat protein [Sedimentisphaerales bacterium]
KQPTLSQEIYQVAMKYDELKKYGKAIVLHQYNVEHFPADIHALWSQVEVVKSFIRDANEPAADAAIKKLLTTFAGQPTLPNEIQQIADAYSGAGKYDKANELYQKSGQIYQTVIDKKPDSNDELWAKVGMAKLNISVGDDAAVQADVNSLIADFNGQPALPQAIFAIGEEYYNKALKAKDEPNSPEARPEGYYQKALTVWERIIKELPDSNATVAAHAHYFSAVCYRKLGNQEKAVEHFQTVVDSWPDYQYAWSAQCLIGECYEKLQRSGKLSASEAEPLIEQAYQAVIERYPDCSLVGHACLKLGDMYLQKGNRDEAATCFELFLKTADPADTRVINTIKSRLEKLRR